MIMAMRRLASALLALPFVAAQTGYARDDQPFTFSRADLQVLADTEGMESQFEHRGLIDHDPELRQHIEALARPFLPAVTPEHVAWRFEVLLDPSVNAFASPGGSVCVTTGMLCALENEDQLAGVLVHEITHVSARDIYLYARRWRGKQAAANAVLGVAVVGMPFGAGVPMLIVAAANRGLGQACMQGYGSGPERHADEAAVRALRSSGRDAAQFLRALALMDQRLDPDMIPSFYTDTVRIHERIDYLRTIVGAPAPPPRSPEGAYINVTSNAIRQDVELEIVSRRYRTAVARAARLVAYEPNNAADLCLLAEAYLALGPRTEAPPANELTAGEEHRQIGRMRNMTAAEEFRTLAATSAGQLALRDNRAKAEALFRRASAGDATLARPHFGLGSLYAQQGRTQDAIQEYRRCIELAPDADDRLRARRRIQALENGANNAQ